MGKIKVKSRLNIGFINPSLHLPWEELQLQGILDRAKDLDINITILPGGRLDSSVSGESSRNILYKLVDSPNLDGLILWSSGLDEFVSHERLSEFIHNYQPLPIVSIEHVVSGVPSIYTNSYESLKQMYKHLIEKHNYRSIGYIRGAENHILEADRFKAYKDAMQESGLSIKPQWILEPQVINQYEIEVQRLRTWYIQYGKELEAVVAFNDRRILNFITVLKSLGVKVPEDLAVCGYDDTPMALYNHPYLTTIKSPFHEMGVCAINMIKKMTEGIPVPEVTVFNGKPVYRESCGCTLEHVDAKMETESNKVLIPLARKTHFQQIVSKMRAELIVNPDIELNKEYFASIFTEGLTQLEIPSSWIFLYENSFKDDDPFDPVNKLIPYFQFKKDRTIKKSSILFPLNFIKQLFVSDRKETFSIIVLPIFFNKTQFGLAVFEMGPVDGDLYQSLLLLLGAFFEGNRLVGKLTDSINELNTTRDLLVQSEKIAALTNLTGGIAHQINTPLGVSITAASHLENMYREKRENSSLSSDEKLSELDNLFHSSLPLIMSHLYKVAELVNSFKEIATNQIIEDKRTILLKYFFAEQILSLNYKWGEKLIIELSCPENLQIKSYPGVISQILTQLVKNSVSHNSPDFSKITISLKIKTNNDKVIIIFKDNGPGINPEIIKNIYDPFFTTKGGHNSPGLGLYIVYNLITQKLNGTIECYNIPQSGVQFIIEFPKL